MHCGTARLLIEALHDDELGVAEAASLLAHIDACQCCAARERLTRRLRAFWRARRPADHCPEALKRRVVLKMRISAAPRAR